MTDPGTPRRLVAELIGTALLLAAVVGSGIMGQRLSGGNEALALLANTLATGLALVVLILTFGAVSGAHFNPVVTLIEAARGAFPRALMPGYIAAQVLGALLGVVLSHLMFGEAPLGVSTKVRSGGAQLFSEVVATFGLVATVRGVGANRPAAVPYAVGAYIASAYWFTASTSFANPAVTLARSFTNTFSGIRPADVPGFIGAQLVGGAVGALLLGWLLGGRRGVAADPGNPAVTSARHGRDLTP